MESLKKLSSHIETRPADLKKAREQGRKIVGYTPGGYFPEELALAAGAIPICMIRGGDYAAAEHAGDYICRWIDTFCRAQIGYGTSGKDPYYSILDLLVIPITDNHVRSISDILDYNTGLEIFPFGVPHMKEHSAFDYYVHGLKRLKSRLEELTGNEITDTKLKEAIDLCNQERELFKKISLARESEQPPISGKDFITLNHGSMLADKQTMIAILESLYSELQKGAGNSSNGTRVLLTGSTLAMGDNSVIEFIEKSGGNVVIEEFAEGIRPYWETVQPNGDPITVLADCYFTRRVPPAWFRPATEWRDFLIKLAEDFKVKGVIWYHLMFRESYKTESYFFPEQLSKETGLPMLVVESDYDPAGIQDMQAHIDVFMQTLRR